jgi:hypothetical protein
VRRDSSPIRCNMQPTARNARYATCNLQNATRPSRFGNGSALSHSASEPDRTALPVCVSHSAANTIRHHSLYVRVGPGRPRRLGRATSTERAPSCGSAGAPPAEPGCEARPIGARSGGRLPAGPPGVAVA